ncbi:MAG: hypothetical protein M3118_02620, partial [Actinomycetota bacterium]|nr:hypothetical protein [Actinomycetota bacterium]
MKRGFFSLRRLRWKLTLSYTLVTVVALLMAELLLVATLVAFLSSPVLPGFVVEDLKETVVPRVEPALSETPPTRRLCAKRCGCPSARKTLGKAQEAWT